MQPSNIQDICEPSNISVLKFGSSVLRSRRDLRACVHEVYRELRRGRRVVAVVSAVGRETDRLLATAKRTQVDPEPRALALLLSTGESRAAALFALELARAGIAAGAVDPSQIGLRAQGDVLDATPIDVDAA